MIYIDFDGVIYNTQKRLEELAECKIDKYDLSLYGLDISVFGQDGFYKESENYLIDKAIYYIRRLKKVDSVTILTKYCTEREKINKEHFIKNYLNLKVKIIFVDKNDSKQDYLNPEDYIVDDQLDNLTCRNFNNILFDNEKEFIKDWNRCDRKNIVTATTWQEVYNHILFVEEIKNR